MKNTLLILLFLITKFFAMANAYGADNCVKLKLEFKKLSDQTIEKIESLKKCAKPAAKYRLKACVQRKEEGSKGLNCSRKLIEMIKNNERGNCVKKFDTIDTLFKKFQGSITNYESCLKINFKNLYSSETH